jgi:hypothetical protein
LGEVVRTPYLKNWFSYEIHVYVLGLGWHKLSQGMLAIIRCRIVCLTALLSKNLKIKIYRIIILPVVLYGCETWSLILREERRLRVFENRVLRRMFGSRRDDVTGMEKITK